MKTSQWRRAVENRCVFSARLKAPTESDKSFSRICLSLSDNRLCIGPHNDFDFLYYYKRGKCYLKHFICIVCILLYAANGVINDDDIGCFKVNINVIFLLPVKILV